IEAHLVGGGIGDVAVVLNAALFGVHGLLNTAHREAQEFVDATHPTGIPSRQVVIDGHYVNTASRPGEPRYRGGAGERLPFASLHLGDAAARQGQRTLQLDLEHIETEDAPGHDGYDSDDLQQILRSAETGAQTVVVQTHELRAATLDPAGVFGDRRGFE